MWFSGVQLDAVGADRDPHRLAAPAHMDQRAVHRRRSRNQATLRGAAFMVCAGSAKRPTWMRMGTGMRAYSLLNTASRSTSSPTGSRSRLDRCLGVPIDKSIYGARFDG